jgi:hypothetical protein
MAACHALMDAEIKISASRYLHQNGGLENVELFRCRFLMHIETMIYGYARVSTAAQDESSQVLN